MSVNYAEVEKRAQSTEKLPIDPLPRRLRRSGQIELNVLLIASGTDELIL